MRWISKSYLAAATAALLPINFVSAQTWSSCNPMHSTCPADDALGMAINVDFTKGSVNSFAASGSPQYDDEGVAFTVSKGGDAPQLASLFYIMFGRVEITMKAAPGAGIVSSLVLQSDVLDEIDIEWLGAANDEIQSNYFGKGQTTSYNRGEFHDVTNTQGQWITYTIDWTKDRIVWMAAGTVVRTLNSGDAEANQYPQTPMQVKFGAWAGGDPNTNGAGTVKWARGPTDFSQGPFTMHVKSIIVTDYSTGDEYKYKDNSGSWESIEAVGGSVNGNENGEAMTVTATAEGTVATADNNVPVGGIAEDGSPATATQTGWPWTGTRPSGGAIPSGWRLNAEGRIIPEENSASSLMGPYHSVLVLVSVLAGILTFTGRLF
ncbi:GH16 domain-containing protein [Fusarium keratoplasticum]|uniref:GH16 domain-containing protein n=1 Tax=Fusarium keratoplasticum TaxID=1328300 RepID=A0ACC0R460_9HYPO|nr:GH16 domain-containing protein [Fusarium keratoplasticum]KAI8671266.1 GH16 domain-containing protein [Fusarium keratoplasticum]KAI8678498.1 GH16 domain-containing protein [Fusarium keratoplasticum]